MLEMKYEAQVPLLNANKLTELIVNASDRARQALARRGKEILEEQFGHGGTWEGTWAPLEASTVARKGHDIILFETGDLWASPFIRKEPDGDWVFGISSDKVDLTIHEFGSPTRKIPARPMMGPAARRVRMEAPKIIAKYGSMEDMWKALHVSRIR